MVSKRPIAQGIQHANRRKMSITLDQDTFDIIHTLAQKAKSSMTEQVRVLINGAWKPLMSLSNSRHAYLDCFSLLDRALEDPRGIRAEVPSLNNALRLRLRIHQARAIDRKDNASTYDPDHPLHGRSPYDLLVCRIEEVAGRAWVYLDKVQVQIGVIEPILEDWTPVQMVEPPKPQLQIEYKPTPAPEVALTIRRR